ncbi:hypothetical protein [Brachybacterium sp. NPDC056505]|uniref:hypothetical protein n=1 Tax=Brachybacterium sp. NPDC056505 TaxID=3345843 RepID=UPI00367261F9
MSTAEDFRNSRFATHPDGRIAHRAAPTLWASTSSTPPGDPIGTWMGTNTDMAADGWSPLDETRPPRVVTDEGAARGVRALRTMFPESLSRLSSQGLDNLVRVAVNASLSAAPTTDEGDPSVDYHAMWWKAEREREQAEAFAALWKETARYLWKSRKECERFEAKAKVERDEAIAHDRQPYPTAHAYEATCKALAEQRARAVKAEQERDAMRDGWNVTSNEMAALESMTAREHLDAAWSAAYVPADGIVPAGAAYITRYEGDTLLASPDGGNAEGLPARGNWGERRLLDPPAPVVSYTKRLALELENAGWIREGGAEGVAEHLDALGVRAPEDGEE